MTYTAANIRILEPEQAIERWTWAKVGHLATVYNRPAAWIARAMEACDRAGVAHDYFVDRYLKKLPVPLDRDVDRAMRDIVREVQSKTPPEVAWACVAEGRPPERPTHPKDYPADGSLVDCRSLTTTY